MADNRGDAICLALAFEGMSEAGFQSLPQDDQLALARWAEAYADPEVCGRFVQ